MRIAMQKLMVSLTDPQYEWIDAEAERLGISRAEVVRRVLDRHREELAQRMGGHAVGRHRDDTA